MSASTEKHTPQAHAAADHDGDIVSQPEGPPRVPARVAVAPPPAGALSPSPPDGWMPEAIFDLRGTRPHRAEQACLPSALSDLRGCSDYREVFGRTAPARAFVVDALDAAQQWSVVVSAAADWYAYARRQEGLVWADAQALVAKLKPAVELTVAANPAFAAQFPGLVRLLDVRRSVARRGAAVRTANARDRKAGRTPSHGKVAARRVRVLKQAAALQAAEPPVAGPATAPSPTKA